MRNFLIKLIFFALLYLTIIGVVKSFLDPFYGNEFFNKKHKVYLEKRDQINTIFIGSSKTYRHVNPHVCDSILTGYNISSFNLGSPGTPNPETYYLYEELLAQKQPNLKYVFLELQPLGFIDFGNINTERNYYWRSLGDLSFALCYILDSNESLKRKLLLSYGHIASYVMKKLNFTNYKMIEGDSELTPSLISGKRLDGFYSLDEQLSETRNDSSYYLRRMEFLSDTSLIQQRIQAAGEHFETDSYPDFMNECHLQKLLHLIRVSDAAGIQLIFVITPLLHDYRYLLALKSRLPHENVIEVASYRKYPELYQTTSVFDIGHLNANGAQIFSRELAKEFEKILREKK